jgi:hypothetical protein
VLPLRDAGAAPAGCRCADSDGDGVDDCSERLEGTDPADPADVGPDRDFDGVPDATDVCPADADPAQADADFDGAGDACDDCPADPVDACVDPDADGFRNGRDNCDVVANPSQANRDGDWLGDACDNCPTVTDFDQADADADEFGDRCDACPAAADNVCFAQVQGVRVVREGASCARLTWNEDAAVGRYDVAGGFLADLVADRGFASAACVANAVDAETALDCTPGSRWYLVRVSRDGNGADYGGGAGTWGNAQLDAASPCP